MPFPNRFQATTFTVKNASSPNENAAIIIVSGVSDSLLGGKVSRLGLVGNPLDLVALNPQPLPPEPPDITFGISNQIDNLLDLVALNPQPLPPEPPDITFGISNQMSNLFDLVALNPQPLPPREIFGHALVHFGL